MSTHPGPKDEEASDWQEPGGDRERVVSTRPAPEDEEAKERKKHKEKEFSLIKWICRFYKPESTHFKNKLLRKFLIMSTSMNSEML